MVAENNKPLPPEGGDQKAGASQPSTYEQSQTAATKRFLEDSRPSEPGNNKSSQLPGDTTESGALKVDDGSDTDTPGSESALDMMLREVETARKAASEAVSAVGKLVSEGLPQGLADKFGNLMLFDPESAPEGSGGQTTEVAQQAKAEAAKTKETDNPTDQQGEAGESSAIGEALSDFGSWAADSFNKYVAEPISEAMSDITTAFDDAFQWLGKGDMVQAKGPIAGINNGNDEYRAAENQAARNNRFNLNGAQDRGGEDLRMPENAVEAGTVEIGGNQVKVFKTPEGDTYLKQGDKVIGKQGADGAFNLALKDGSNLDFKMSKGENGEYKLDSLERTKDGKLQQKLADGVFYNYNYDAQGNRTSVDAAGDLKGPLTPERLEAIKKELGDSGAAALRVTDKDNKVQRLLMQAHDKDTSSLTDIDAKRAQIFHNGKEYRLNEQDQIGIVDSNGNWQAPETADTTESQDPESQESSADPSRKEEVERLRAEQQKKLEDLARRLRRRAQGNSDEAVDGVKLGRDANDNATVTRENPNGGQPLTTTEIPADADKPIHVTNSNGEKIDLKGENVSVKSKTDERIFDFDKENGLKTDDLIANPDGLKDKDGKDITDGNGEFVGGLVGAEEEYFGGEDCEDCAEAEQNEVTSDISTTQLVKHFQSVTGAINSGNPQAAFALGTRALAIGNSALAAVGNDTFAQITISHAMGNLRALMAQAAGNPEANQPSSLNSPGRDRLRIVA